MNKIIGKELFFGKGGNGAPFMTRGWRQPEPDFTWSIGEKAVLTIPIEQKESLLIRINLSAFLVSNFLPRQRVNIRANGFQVENFIVSNEGFHDRIIKIPAEILVKETQLTIELSTPDSCSPKSLGLSIDPDLLGIGLKCIVFFNEDFFADIVDIGQTKKFTSQQDFISFQSDDKKVIQKYIAYERLQQSTNSNSSLIIKGYCEACNKKSKFSTSFPNDSALSIHNPYRDGAICDQCGLISRHRFVVSKLKKMIAEGNNVTKKIYLYESASRFKKFVEQNFADHQVIGSEYLGNNITPGEIIDGIRHENALNLSFSTKTIDVIIANDVFEHVPSITKTLEEAYRVLKKGGHLLFTIPFSHSVKETTLKRATLKHDEITHLLPPQYHENPVTKQGSLVFYDFGWDIIQKCNHTGFTNTYALNYYNINFGYLGIEGNFLFVAEKQ